MKTWTRIKDPLKWVSVACALTATSTAEYDLAVAIGMNGLVAVAVPGALDAYVLRAVQRKREVFTSVLAMVGVNAVSHLHTGGVLPMGWQLITGVSAIAPLVLWRVHALRSPSTARKRLLWGVPKDVPDSVLESGCPLCLHEHTGPCEHFAGTSGACPCGHAENTREHMCLVCMSTLPGEAAFVAHMAGHGITDVKALAEHGDDLDVPDWVNAPSTPVPVPVPVHAPGRADLELVPDPAPAESATSTRTPKEWDAEHVSTGTLLSTDTRHTDKARELFRAREHVPGVREIKEHIPSGTPRAQRLRAALKVEHEASTEGGTT